MKKNTPEETKELQDQLIEMKFDDQFLERLEQIKDDFNDGSMNGRANIASLFNPLIKARLINVLRAENSK